MTPLRVADATDPSSPERQAFHAVAEPVYAPQPAGSAPSPASIERNLARDAFTGRQRAFVVMRGSAPCGRVVARLSPSLADAEGRPVGMLGFYEAIDAQDVASALFDAAVTWLRGRGAGRIVGPMDGDTWHRYRVNVGPYDDPPFPLEPWNPPYYQAHWERAGFVAAETYSSKWIDDVAQLLPGLARGADRAVERGVRVRGLRREAVENELAIVHELSSRIFADAVLYTPISRAEFLALYRGAERMLDPALVLFAESDDGNPVGFVFGYADPGRPAVHYKTIGVLAEWRRAAVAALLSQTVYRNALAMGRPHGNHALMRDDNRSQALDQELGRVFRRYVLYEWSGT